MVEYKVLAHKSSTSPETVEGILNTAASLGYRLVGIEQPMPSVGGQWDYRLILERPAKGAK